MKQNIHPQYNTEAKVVCACGNAFSTGSTLDSIRVDICYKCHPFFTGQQKFVDTMGRVDKFQVKSQKAAEQKAVREEKIQAKQRETKSQERLSLRDLLMQARKNS